MFAVRPFQNLKIFLFILLFAAAAAGGFAHPFDISITTIKVEEKGFLASTYIHGQEITLLAQENKIDPKRLTMDQLKIILLSYFDQHFKVYGKNGILPKLNIKMEEAEIFQILSSGVYINFYLKVAENDYPIVFSVDLFIEYFVTQTNKIVLLDDTGNLYPDSCEILLTPNVREWQFDIADPDFKAYKDDLKDTDGDGLNDFFEELYGLNAYAADSDFDGYTDSEEFNFGWDPFDPKPAPDQSRDVINQARSDQNGGAATTYTDKNVINISIDDGRLADQLKNSRLLLSTVEGGFKNLADELHGDKLQKPEIGFLGRIVSDIKKLFTVEFNFGGLLLLLVSVFALGFFYAYAAGYEKGILIAYLTEGNKNFFHGLGFIITFTLVHLFVVILLAALVVIFSLIIDSAVVMYIFQIVGGIGLVLAAVFLILKGINQVKGREQPQVDSIIKTKRSAMVMGMLAGLRPCWFGLILVNSLLTIGRLELIPLIVPFFALGIFAFLFLLSLVIFVVRYMAFDIFNKLSRYSLLISGVMLLVFSLLFFIPNSLL